MADASNYLDYFQATPSSIGASSTNFLGTFGLPGTSTNQNPLSITTPQRGTTMSGFISDIANTTLSGAESDLSQAIDVLSGDPLGPTGQASGGAASAQTGAGTFSSSTISAFFLRSVIIILGFIFVAVGLSMFKGNSILETVKKVKP